MFFGFFLLLSPIVFLFIFGLDVLVLRANPLIFIIGAIVIIVVGTLLFEKKFKNSKITMAMKTSTLNTSFLTLASNLGEKKIYPIIVLYCIISFSLSIYEIVDFDFENTKSIKKSSETNLVKLREESYETKRNTKLRIQKAAIESFEVTDNTIRLFISYYKEDKFTVKNIETNPEFYKDFSSDITDSIQVSMPDLYGIYIDEEKISGLTWYKIRKKSPNQKGFVTMIPLDNIENGSHILKIDKIHWDYDKKQFKIIENWDLIPFEKQIVPL
jgi:hypothetical protein